MVWLVSRAEWATGLELAAAAVPGHTPAVLKDTGVALWVRPHVLGVALPQQVCTNSVEE